MPRQSQPLLSILIAVSSRVDLLARCLESVQQHMPAELPYEVIVVLNGLEPAVVDQLRSTHHDVMFVRSPVNLGMAGSGNRARLEASGRFLVTLHDDATIEPGWAEALLQAAHDHPRAGAIGSKVLYPDGRLQSAGYILWRSGWTARPWDGAAPEASAVMAARPVDYCGTCALLIRAEAFDAVGGFDDQIYPAYYVDVDLGLALRSKGYYVLCEPRSVIRHHRGSSSGTAIKRVASNRNREYLLRKWTAAVACHEAQPQPGEQHAIEAALLRAARFAEACEAGEARPIQQKDAGSSGQERCREDVIDRHYRLSCQLHQAIVEHLENELAARDAILARRQRAKLSLWPTGMRAWRRSLKATVRRLRAGFRRASSRDDAPSRSAKERG
jgi:GT2 family glycosyltransferase